MTDSSYENVWGGFDEKMLDRAERNWENRQKRHFENSDIDTDWDMSQVRDLSSGDQSSNNSDSESSDSKFF